MAEPATWTCFHCGETFTDTTCARKHFGGSEIHEAACRIKASEGGLIRALRNAEDALSRYHAWDSDAYRAMGCMQVEHATELRREEEKGYACGLADGAVLLDAERAANARLRAALEVCWQAVRDSPNARGYAAVEAIRHVVPGIDDMQNDACVGAAIRALAPAESDAVRDVVAERQRQQAKKPDGEGWTPEHDDMHTGGELAAAAACYAVPALTQVAPPAAQWWPWNYNWWKPKDRRSDLVRAGALILAEIERLDRAALAKRGAS